MIKPLAIAGLLVFAIFSNELGTAFAYNGIPVYALLPLSDSSPTIPSVCSFSNGTTSMKCKGIESTVTIVGGTGINVNINTATQTITILAKAANGTQPFSLTCPAGQFFSAYDNSTRKFTCSVSSGGSGSSIYDTMQNVGSGTASFYAGNSTLTNFQFKKFLAGANISITNGTQLITISANGWQNNTGSNLGSNGIGLYSGMGGTGNTVLQFLKLVSANNQCSITSNSTNAILNCNSVSAGITSINSDTTAAQLLEGTSGNITVADAMGGIHIINLGQNAVVTDGSAQTVTKGLTVNSLTLGGDENANSHKITSLSTPTLSTDAQNAGHIGLLGSLVIGTCSNNQVLKYQTSNSTWICSTQSTGITSINSDITTSQIIQGVAGNTSISTLSGTTTVNIASNVVTTGGSAQVVSKGVTLNSMTLGGNALGNNKNFTGLNNINGSKLFQGSNQAIDTINGAGSVTVSGSGNSRTVLGHTYQNNTGINLGIFGLGVYSGMSGSTLQFKSITCGVNIQCSSNATNVRINGTSSTAITSLNGDTTAAQNIVGQTGNTTITNSTGHVKIGLGVNVVNTGGSTQTVTKGLTLNSLILGGDANANSHKITGLSTPTLTTDAQRVDHIGLNLISIGTCLNGQTYVFQSSNSTMICTTILTSDIDPAPKVSINAQNRSSFINVPNSTGTNSFSGANNFTGSWIDFFTNPIILTPHRITFPTNASGVVCLRNQTGACGSSSGGGVTSVLGSDTNITSTGGSTPQINIGSNVDTLAQDQKIVGHKTIQNPQINGIDLAYVSKTTAYSVTKYDNTIAVDTSACGNPCVVTLPDATINVNQTFTIKRLDFGKNILMIDPTGSQKIDQFLNYNITSAKESITIQSDGSNWQTLSLEPDSIFNYRALGNGGLRWYGNAITAYTPTTIAPTTTTISAYPLVVSKSLEIDKIQLEVSTLVAGSTCRMGIYNDNGTSYPSTLISGSDVGTVSGASTGVKTNTFGSPIMMSKGLYWLASQCSTATTIVLRASTSTSSPNILGIVSTMGTTATGTGWSATNTFGAFPHQFPTAGATVLTGNVPEVLVHPIG